MNTNFWLDIVSRLSPNMPLDLDGEMETEIAPINLGDTTARTKSQSSLPSTIFAKSDISTIALGIRVTEPVKDPATVALHLATLALERHVYPVILATVGYTGFEQFGFRVERIDRGNPDEAAAQEEELKQFWNMAIVVDLKDVLLMA